jgi:prephenate dehydrogenase
MRARIIGLGLIGGSAGMALRRAGWRVSYFDPFVPLEDALASGAVDEAGENAATPDIALLATGVDVALDVLPRQECLTMSMCSVMHPLRAAAGSRHFVAGHPLAGRATRGLAAASPDLFAGKRWFVDWDDPIAMQVIRDCGAEPVLVDAAQHDAAIALTSHIPQMLSTALAAYLDERDVAEFAGPGLATFLRLARSDARVWEATIAANRGNIEPHLEGIFRVLERMLEGDSETFEKAQRFMDRLGSGL